MGCKILIGIQARSSSTRLPRKAFERIGGKMLLERVLIPCDAAASYLKRFGHDVRVVLLTPVNDPIVQVFEGKHLVIQGPEQDVLARYAMAVQKLSPDLVVRITGDCPMQSAAVIGKHVGLADQYGYDYVSNVDERFRTSLDGVDCEVISSRLLIDTHQRAVKPEDREHVTTMIRREPPSWARIGVVCDFFDLSHMKLSVDTPEDLERVRDAFDKARGKYERAVETFGKEAVHRV